jgi:hypothetical protein
MLQMTLGSALRRALRRELPTGWLYLPDTPSFMPDTPCVLVDEPDPELDERSRPLQAVRSGFPQAGLSTDMMGDTGDCAKSFQDPPSDELLVESFTYYLRFDAYLPSPGAPEPPPWEETQRELDRAFYDALGPERSDHPCERDGCQRGAITHSVLCKGHHFENIHDRPCPFDD